jgi:succinate-semialdehyde dehydrogenase/glutarate-semialdehyde dehydrogenase
VNVFTTSTSGAVSEPIIRDPRLRKLSFTGSTQVGQRLMQQAAQGVLRTSMELGGNAPFVVFDDADLDKAVDGAMLAKFRNIGQACTAANRFIVQRSVADEFARRVTERVQGLKIGRGTEDGVAIGPLINDAAVEKASSLVTDAVARGAQVRTGGSAIDGPGTFYEPTVVTDVRPGSDILREEIFGPVLAIITFDEIDEAIAMANRSQYGLVAGVWTRDINKAMTVASRIKAGQVYINTYGAGGGVELPFGGYKKSGYGREKGLESLASYTQVKNVCVKFA